MGFNTCKKCKLHKTAKTVKVEGRVVGNSPEILIIGEAPGWNEDREGVPFIGKAGSELDIQMKKAGIKDYYLDNIVKCIPKNSADSGFRKPLKDEKLSCFPYLFETIEEMLPKTIVTLGNVPTEVFTGNKSGITKTCGIPTEIAIGSVHSYLKNTDIDRARVEQVLDGVNLIPCIHPSAVIRGSAPRSKCVGALKTAKSLNSGEEYRKDEVNLIEGYDSDRFFNTERFDRSLEYLSDVIVFNTINEFETFANDVNFLYTNGKIDHIDFDVESNSFFQYKDFSKLLCISFAISEGSSYVMPVQHSSSPFIEEDGSLSIETRKRLKSILETIFKIPVEGHNLKFDIHWMISQFGIRDFYVYMCTMMADHFLNAGRFISISLDGNIDRRLDMPNYSHTIDEFLDQYKKDDRNYSLIPRDMLYKYAGCDADATHRVGKAIREELKDMQLMGVYEELYIDTLMPTIRMETKGCRVDKDEYDILKIEYPKKLKECTSKVKETFYYDTFLENTDYDDLNLNSYQQKGVLLYDIMKLEVLKRTKKTNNASTASNIIEKLIVKQRDMERERGDDNLIQARIQVLENILEYSKYQTRNSLFVQKMPDLWSKRGTPDYWKELTGEDELCKDYTFHSDFLIGLAKTGRWRNKDPNLQQLPTSNSDIKRAIISRFDDAGIIIASDYSQLEIRVMAMLAQSDILRDTFIKGEDVHKQVASLIQGIPVEEVTSEIRSVHKSLNFGIMYGMGASSLALKCGISKLEAEELIHGYFDRLPKVDKWREDTIEFCKENGFVFSPLGRARYIDMSKEVDEDDEKSNPRNQAMNSPIQGTASDLNQFGFVYTDTEIRKLGLKSFPFSLVHDSLELDSYLPEFKTNIKLLHRCQVDRVQKRICDFDYNVPLAIDFEIGLSWGDCLETEDYFFDGNDIVFTLLGEEEVFNKVTNRLKVCFDVDVLNIEDSIEENEKIFKIAI